MNQKSVPTRIKWDIELSKEVVFLLVVLVGLLLISGLMYFFMNFDFSGNLNRANDVGILEGPSTWYFDNDCDGYGNGTFVVSDERPFISRGCVNSLDEVSTINLVDCNEESHLINPGMVELCWDGLDNDCNDGVDEGCSGSPRCDPFLNATWSDDGDLLAGEFDYVSLPAYLSINESGGNYSLRAEGLLGDHKYERAVVANLSSLDVWGGSISVNLHEMQFSSPYDLALVGGFDGFPVPNTPKRWWRDFVIAADSYNGDCWMYFRGYHYSDFAVSGPGLGAVKIGDGQVCPDRFVDVDWYFTPSRKLFVSVDGGDFNEAYTGSNHIAFESLAVGWVSSYNGGNVKFSNVELYNESCVPTWVLEGTCVDECASLGDSCLDPLTVESCKDTNRDGCFESTISSCESGETCASGVCLNGQLYCTQDNVTDCTLEITNATNATNTNPCNSSNEFEGFQGCVLYECDSGFEINNSECLAIEGYCEINATQNCSIDKGIGEQVALCVNNSLGNYSNCSVQSCNSGYKISGNTCIVDGGSSSSGSSSSSSSSSGGGGSGSGSGSTDSQTDQDGEDNITIESNESTFIERIEIGRFFSVEEYVVNQKGAAIFWSIILSIFLVGGGVIGVILAWEKSKKKKDDSKNVSKIKKA